MTDHIYYISYVTKRFVIIHVSFLNILNVLEILKLQIYYTTISITILKLSVDFITMGIFLKNYEKNQTKIIYM